MAIYHLHVKIVKRSAGKNIISAAAYRRATKLFDEREQTNWDYSNKKDVIHSELFVPKDSPDWLLELVELQQTQPSLAAEKLWNRVDVSEKRIDSQLAREVEFSLPLELTAEQNIQLAREFIQDQFVSRGMIADWNVHYDRNNPHVHVLLSMRELTHEGFGKKVVEWNQKQLLQIWREKWAEYANFHLKLHHHDVRIDHRSYQEQGIDLIPSQKQGKSVTDMERRGIKTEIMVEANRVRRENLQRIAAQPEVIIDKLASQSDTFTQEQITQELGRYINDRGNFLINDPLDLAENESQSQKALTPDAITKILTSIEYHDSVFSEKQIAKAVSTHTDHAQDFAKAILQIKSCSELLALGPGDDGRERFTTRKMFNLENDIQTLSDRLRDRRHRMIPVQQIQKILHAYQTATGKELTDEQFVAIKHVLKPHSLSCMIGRAGTGKSFSLGAAKAVWQAQGLRVHGVALSGIAADGLNKDAGIQSRTIESFRYALRNRQLVLNAQDVIVMDEAGMTDSVAMHAVLKAVQQAKSKLVLVGDPAQIQPVGPGASFRAILERVSFTEIQTIYRQQGWQAEATQKFSQGKIKEGLKHYTKENCIHFDADAPMAVTRLVNDWFATRQTHKVDLNQLLVIAHRNQDVTLLNQSIREGRIKNGEIAPGYTVQTAAGEIQLATNDRVLFLKNDRHLGVNNGRFATVQSVDFHESGKVKNFKVIPDDTQKEVTIHPQQYSHFTHGYAATVHKVQGMTVDHSFVYTQGHGWNRHLTYVAMSRHRKSCQLYACQNQHQNLNMLQKQLGRYGIKDSLLDFPLAFATRRGIETMKLERLLPKQLAIKLKSLHEKLQNSWQQWRDPESHIVHQSTQAKAEKIQLQREDAKLVAAYVDAYRNTGKAWQQLQIDANSENHLLLKQACKERAEIARTILQDKTRYEKALALYGIDTRTLTEQVAQYHRTKQTNVKRSQQREESLSTVKAMTLEQVLSRYIEMELEQSKLVAAMPIGTAKNESAIAAKKAATLHRRKLQDFATHAIQHSGIVSLQKEHRALPSSATLNYTNAKTALEKNQLSLKDKLALVNRLHQHATWHLQTLTQNRKQDRGGRSR